jgi:8-oxo-dGTP diphosphatase
VQQYRYPHAHVLLHFFRVFEWDGDPVGHDGQAFAWQTPGNFGVAPLLPANTFVLRALLLPPVYGISMADELGEAEFLARAKAALERGLALVQIREKGWPMSRQQALAAALIALARPHGAKMLLNGEVKHARAWGCDGVHWTADALAAATARPDGLLCGASCHTRLDIERAGRLGLDFAVLGPVLPTPSHPGGRTLGWEAFATIAELTPLPIYALGGLEPADMAIATAHGAHGVALRRAAWPAV